MQTILAIVRRQKPVKSISWIFGISAIFTVMTLYLHGINNSLELSLLWFIIIAISLSTFTLVIIPFCYHSTIMVIAEGRQVDCVINEFREATWHLICLVLINLTSLSLIFFGTPIASQRDPLIIGICVNFVLLMIISHKATGYSPFLEYIRNEYLPVTLIFSLLLCGVIGFLIAFLGKPGLPILNTIIKVIPIAGLLFVITYIHTFANNILVYRLHKDFSLEPNWDNFFENPLTWLLVAIAIPTFTSDTKFGLFAISCLPFIMIFALSFKLFLDYRQEHK